MGLERPGSLPMPNVTNSITHYGCQTCQKNDVCKWSDEFTAFAKLTEEAIPSNLSDFVKIEATCKYYHQKPQGGIR